MFKIMSALALFMMATPLYAMDKNKVHLDQVFWGTWAVSNPHVQCKETYQFSKPGRFSNQMGQKKMDGEFVVLRSANQKESDILKLQITADNGLADCTGNAFNYTGQQAMFALKWKTPESAELCVDALATKCTGLHLNKQR